jgi:hypothetical protein
LIKNVSKGLAKLKGPLHITPREKVREMTLFYRTAATLTDAKKTGRLFLWQSR